MKIVPQGGTFLVYIQEGDRLEDTHFFGFRGFSDEGEPGLEIGFGTIENRYAGNGACIEVKMLPLLASLPKGDIFPNKLADALGLHTEDFQVEWAKQVGTWYSFVKEGGLN